MDRRKGTLRRVLGSSPFRSIMVLYGFNLKQALTEKSQRISAGGFGLDLIGERLRTLFPNPGDSFALLPIPQEASLAYPPGRYA